MHRRKMLIEDRQNLVVVAWMMFVVFVYGVLVGYSGRGVFSADGTHRTDTGYGRFGEIARSLEGPHH